MCLDEFHVFPRGMIFLKRFYSYSKIVIHINIFFFYIKQTNFKNRCFDLEVKKMSKNFFVKFLASYATYM